MISVVFFKGALIKSSLKMVVSLDVSPIFSA